MMFTVSSATLNLNGNFIWSLTFSERKDDVWWDMATFVRTGCLDVELLDVERS